jgi:hypothetical protein
VVPRNDDEGNTVGLDDLDIDRPVDVLLRVPV